MKTPVGAKSSSRRPLQQLPPNSLRDAVPTITSNENNLSRVGTKDTKNTDIMKDELEKHDLLVESIEKQIHNMKINNDTKTVVNKNPEPKIEYNIQALSEGVRNVSLEESLAKSDLKNRQESNVYGDEDKQKIGSKAKVQEKKPNSDKEGKGPETSDAAKDENTGKEPPEIETNLCSRGPSKGDRSLHRPTPYLNKNIIFSQSHHSGGGIVSVTEVSGQSHGMVNHMTGPVCNAYIPGDETQFPVDALNDPILLKSVQYMLEQENRRCYENPDTVPSLNIATGMYGNEVELSPLYNIDEGGPESPDSGYAQLGCVSPFSVVDYDPPGDLEETLKAEIDSNRYTSPRGPPSVDSVYTSEGAPSPLPELNTVINNPQSDLVEPNFPNLSHTSQTSYGDNDPVTPQAALLPFPKSSSLPQPASVYHVSVASPTPSSSLPSNSVVQPQTQTRRPLRIRILPPFREKLPVQKKFDEKLNLSHKNSSWTKVISIPKELLTETDKDGDTQLMIILSNRCNNFLEVVYALVERLRKIPGALATKNKKGHSALYIASLLLPDEPLVAAYIAEALLEQGINVAQLEYDGQPLIECIKEKGPSHQKVLDELHSLKDKNGQYVFGHQINYNITVRQ